MNVWGIRYYSDMKSERMRGIARFLRRSDYDIIFIQELWTPEDYKMLRSSYRYGSQHGSPGSLTCPLMDAEELHFLHISPLDCNGLTILSKHKILDTEWVFYEDKVPALMETLVRKGAMAVRMEIKRRGRSKLRLTAVNSHFSGWFSEQEQTYSYIRESQARSLLDFVMRLQSSSDLVIMAADLNSTPRSPAYSLLSSHLTDTLPMIIGDHQSWSPEHDTWGHVNNTWSGPSHPESYRQRCRIDYIMYKARTGLKVKVSSYRTLGEDINIKHHRVSLSDHMWTEATLTIS